jgi:hypothetical protein
VTDHEITPATPPQDRPQPTSHPLAHDLWRQLGHSAPEPHQLTAVQEKRSGLQVGPVRPGRVFVGLGENRTGELLHGAEVRRRERHIDLTKRGREGHTTRESWSG